MHRRWEDWLGAGLGLLVGVTPWLAGETSDENLAPAHRAAGPAHSPVLPYSGRCSLRAAGRKSASWRAAYGWPPRRLMLAYADAGNLADWHLALGLVVMVLALLEIWQSSAAHQRGDGRGLASRQPRPPLAVTRSDRSPLEQLDRHALGAAQEAMRMPGRMVVGSMVNSAPLALSSADDSIDARDRQAEVIEPLIGRARRGIGLAVGQHLEMKTSAPPTLRSMRGLPCCMVRITSAPNMRS